MTFYSFLKTARERCGITQAEFAEGVGVSITTIQNWEKDTLPGQGYWQVIIDQLKLSREEFIRYYANTVLPCNDETSAQPFPDFLFPDNLLDAIKNMKLTADEQELLGLEIFYDSDYDMTGEYKFKVTKKSSLPVLPYEYVHRVGAFHVMNLHDSLTDKIGGFRDYVIAQIKKNPEAIFDISKCSPAQLLALCKCIVIRKDSYKTYTWEEEIQIVIERLKQIEGAGNSLTIAKTSDRDYGDRWEKFDEYSTFAYDEFIRLVEKESQDDDYIEMKEKYEKDKLFYEEHSSMMDHCPQAPRYRGTKNVEMTERGKQLLDWYKNNF